MLAEELEGDPTGGTAGDVEYDDGTYGFGSPPSSPGGQDFDYGDPQDFDGDYGETDTAPVTVGVSPPFSLLCCSLLLPLVILSRQALVLQVIRHLAITGAKPQRPLL